MPDYDLIDVGEPHEIDGRIHPMTEIVTETAVHFLRVTEWATEEGLRHSPAMRRAIDNIIEYCRQLSPYE